MKKQNSIYITFKVKSELYGQTDCVINDVERAIKTGFAPCGDGSDYKLTPDEIGQLQRIAAGEKVEFLPNITKCRGVENRTNHKHMKTITIQELKEIATGLIDDGTNIEYCRAICELIADCDGVPEVGHAERSIQIGIELGLSEYASAKMYKSLIGFQIESGDGRHRIPEEFSSFEVLTESVADFWMEHYDDGSWKKVPIYHGDIENPKMVEYL